MKFGRVLKTFAMLAAVSTLQVSAMPFSVMAEANTEAQFRKELEGAMITQRQTFLANQLAACAEETRIAKEYLGGLKTLAQVNASYASYIEAAEKRLVTAQRAQKMAETALKMASNPSLDASEFNALPANQIHTIGIVDRDAEITEYFDVETTGAPSDPKADLIISDCPDDYLESEGYRVLSRDYTGESLKEVQEQSETAGKTTGTITVDGKMPGGGYADRVAVEISVANGRSLVFLWENDGRVSVVDKD